MLGISVPGAQDLGYAPTVRRAEALEQIERSMGRIGRAGSSVTAARRRAAAARVEVSAPGMGILGVLERGGPQRVSAVARRAGMVGTLVSRELRGLERAGYVARRADGSDGRAVVVSLTPRGATPTAVCAPRRSRLPPRRSPGGAPTSSASWPAC